MNIQKVLIVEDELLIAEHIASILRGEGYSDIRITDSVEFAIVEIEAYRPDIVLTDISLGDGESGIQLGALLNSKFHIPFIYISSHASMDMVKAASATLPNSYLIKPFKAQDIIVAIEIALYSDKVKKEGSEIAFLSIKEGALSIKLAHEEITAILAEENYSIIHTLSSKPRPVRLYLSELHALLPESQFIRIHKSHLVNKKHITRLNSGIVELPLLSLPIGRSYRPGLLDALKDRQ